MRHNQSGKGRRSCLFTLVDSLVYLTKTAEMAPLVTEYETLDIHKSAPKEDDTGNIVLDGNIKQ